MTKVSAYASNDSTPRDGGSRKGPQLVETHPTGVQQSGPLPSCQDKDLSDMEDVIKRLRMGKYTSEDGNAAGEQWAKRKASYHELKKLYEYDETGLDDPALDSDVFLRAIGVDPQKGPSFWAEAGYSGRGKPPPNFLFDFCLAARGVFAEVVDKL